MRLDARTPEKPAGVLLDTGTNRRIPFARWCDFETGEYEHFALAPNGVDMLVGENNQMVVVRGRAVGKLRLVEIGRASDLGVKPGKSQSPIEPMDASEKRDGLEVYKKVFFDVWQFRGESGRGTADAWDEFLSKNDFLDTFVLRRRQG